MAIIAMLQFERLRSISTETSSAMVPFNIRCCASRPILECRTRICPRTYPSLRTCPPRPLCNGRTARENPVQAHPIRRCIRCLRNQHRLCNNPPKAPSACPTGCANRSDSCGLSCVCILACWYVARRGIRPPGTPIHSSHRHPGCTHSSRTARCAAWYPVWAFSISGSPCAMRCAAHPRPASNNGISAEPSQIEIDSSLNRYTQCPGFEEKPHGKPFPFPPRYFDE